MPTVKNISLWRKETENKTELLALTLDPLAKAGADLSIVMGYLSSGFLLFNRKGGTHRVTAKLFP